jgi:ribosomal protein S18 acetylase RimI-like enzyme
MILATWMGPDQGHVAEIAVEPAAGRHGVGSALVAGTLAALARLGCRKVNLAVDLDNLGAVRFYRRLGFAVHHRYPSLRLAMSRLRSDPAEAWIGLRTD